MKGSQHIQLIITESEGILERIKQLITENSEVNWKFHLVDRDIFSIKKSLGEDGKPISTGNCSLVYNLKIAVENAENIFIITDPDDEGEALAYNIKNIALKYSEARVRRVKINEVTEDHFRLALSTPELVEENRAIGWLSRSALYSLLDEKTETALRSYLYINKTQSVKLATDPASLVTLEEIRKRELEVKTFTPKKIYFADYEICKGSAVASSLGFTNKEAALAHINKIQEAIDDNVIEVDFASKRVPIRVPPPFTTQNLIKKAYKTLGISPENTLEALKRLYEKGYITYYRTDRLSLNRNFAERIWKYNRSFGMKIVDKPKNYSEYQKFGKPGEVIRPTDLIPPENTKFHYPTNKIYELIWDRIISTQLKPSYVRLQTVDYTLDNGNTLLMTAKGEEIEQEGYGTRYIKQTLKENLLRRFGSSSVREEDIIPTKRYNIIELYKWLNDNDITHQNLYEKTIKNLVESGYIEIEDSIIQIKPLGEIVIKAAKELSEDFVDPLFASQIEEDIRDITQCKIEIAPLMEQHKERSEALNLEIRNKGYYKAWKDIPKKCPECSKTKLTYFYIVIKHKLMKCKCKSCKATFKLIFNEKDILELVPFEDISGNEDDSGSTEDLNNEET